MRGAVRPNRIAERVSGGQAGGLESIDRKQIKQAAGLTPNDGVSHGFLKGFNYAMDCFAETRQAIPAARQSNRDKLAFRFVTIRPYRRQSDAHIRGFSL